MEHFDTNEWGVIVVYQWVHQKRSGRCERGEARRGDIG